MNRVTVCATRHSAARGLLVSEICLGTMTFGGGGFWTAIGTLDQSVADGIVARALDAGRQLHRHGRYVYSDGPFGGRSPAAPWRIPAASGSDVVLATKVLSVMGKGPQRPRRFAPATSWTGVKASLKRLGTDYIDFYQIHGLDPVTPIEETVAGRSTTLVRQGHVRYIGVSNWSAWTIMKALGIADQKGWTRLSTLQAYYTIAGRDLEREIGPVARGPRNSALMVWRPARLVACLSGKIRPQRATAPEGSRRVSFDFSARQQRSRLSIAST